MIRRILALLLLLDCAPCVAREDEQGVRSFAFIGRLIAIKELPDPCEGNKDCIVMDALYQARYAIVRSIAGTYPENEITFSIADHYGFPRMARYQHALLFVGLYSNGPWLHKYQGFPVHRLTDGDWAFCGKLDDDDAAKRSRPLEFASDFASVGEWSEPGLREIYDPAFYSIDDGRVRCIQGVPLQDLYEFVREGVLRARDVTVPAWDDTQR